MALNVAQSELTEIRHAHEKPFKTQGQVKEQDKAFAAFDIITAAVAAGTGNSIAYQSSQGMQVALKGFEAKRRKSDVSVKPNPWFVANGHGDADSPVTQAYLFTRAWKSVGGTAVSLGGSLASHHALGVNFGSALRHGSAAASTGMHLLAIKSIANSNKQTETISRWCDVIIRAKTAKVSLRSMQAVGGALPVPLVGPLVNLAAAAGKLGIKIGLPEMCYLAAIEIHWRAFQEQKISAILGPRVPAVRNFSRPTRQWGASTVPAPGAKKPTTIKVGPASRIFAEIFTRRGITAIGLPYDVPSLINEPAGWMALGDKLSRE